MSMDGPDSLAEVFAMSERRGRLLSGLIELTHRCHLDCDHCYLEDRKDHGRRTEELTTAEVCDVVDQLRDLGVLFLTITGGEPLLRRDLFEILAHARSRHLAVTLYTTGTLLTQTQAEQLAKLQLRRVEMSLYAADPAIHDNLTRVPGSHGKTLKAVERLRKLGVPVLLKSPLMQENFSDYAALVALCEQLAVPLLVDPTVNPCNDGDRHPTGKRLTMAQLTAFFASPALSPYAQVAYRTPGENDGICAIGRRGLVIDPFGQVRTCLGYKPPVGEVREQTLRQIWEGSTPLLQLRRMRVTDLAVCRDCDKSAFCNRCAGLAMADDGERDGPSSWACSIAEAKERAAGLAPRARPSGAPQLPSPPAPGPDRRRRLTVLSSPTSRS